MSKQIITYDSPEAASIQTVTGWVSRSGRFFGNDEHTARYDGCTHRPCGKCGVLIPVNSYCRDCYDKESIEQYTAMPRADWNGSDMLYSEACDEWFQDSNQLAEYCDEHEYTPKELRLIIAVPVYATEIDAIDYYSDELPEDGHLPPEIEDAFEHLNEVIRASKSVLSWRPGKFAATDASILITNVAEYQEPVNGEAA